MPPSLTSSLKKKSTESSWQKQSSRHERTAIMSEIDVLSRGQRKNEGKGSQGECNLFLSSDQILQACCKEFSLCPYTPHVRRSSWRWTKQVLRPPMMKPCTPSALNSSASMEFWRTGPVEDGLHAQILSGWLDGASQDHGPHPHEIKQKQQESIYSEQGNAWNDRANDWIQHQSSCI